jgi:hypothetical protein
MARGFGSTPGGGTTDIIASTITAHNPLRSYAIWTYRNGDGGGGFGCAFQKRNGELADYELLRNDSGGNYYYQNRWNSTAILWSFTRPAASEWHHIAVTYDYGSTANDPVVYVDGSSVTVTEGGTAPSGTHNTNSASYTLGNMQETLGRVWDGSLAEFAIWNAILTSDEAAALGKGVSPLLIRPALLIEYIPMIGPATSWVAGATTITGTAIQPHPRVHYPTHKRDRFLVTAAAAARPSLIGGKLTSSLLLGGLAR